MTQFISTWISRLPDGVRPQVAEALRRHAVRQVATLKASGAALAHAPSLDDRVGAIERAKEELAHLEQASEVYRELSGADLLGDAEQVAAKLPIPGSWLEASVAQLVLCLAARVDFARFVEVATPLRGVTELAMVEEAEHVSAARAALDELCAGSPQTAEVATEYMARWLPVALDSLETGAPRSAYLKELETEVRGLGLRLP